MFNLAWNWPRRAERSLKTLFVVIAKGGWTWPCGSFFLYGIEFLESMGHIFKKEVAYDTKAYRDLLA